MELFWVKRLCCTCHKIERKRSNINIFVAKYSSELISPFSTKSPILVAKLSALIISQFNLKLFLNAQFSDSPLSFQ